MHRSATLLCSGLLLAAAAVAAPPLACSTLSRAEAEKLAGGPLGEVFRHEEKASATNGHDHSTTCAYFPKGYNIRTADAPPERGIKVTLHAMRNAADAKTFYENTASMQPDMVRQMVGPDAKVTSPAGLGEAAQLAPMGDKAMPMSVVSLYVLKRSVVAQVQAWQKGAPADAVAKNAAAQVIARLP